MDSQTEEAGDAAQHSPLSDGQKSLWSEGSLCVNVHGLPFTTTLVDGQLERKKDEMKSFILGRGFSKPTLALLSVASCFEVNMATFRGQAKGNLESTTQMLPKAETQEYQ